MSKTFATVFTVALFALLGSAGNAFATGNPCPPASPFPGIIPPNCGNGGDNNGHGSRDTSCTDHVDNDGDGKTDMADSECRDPSDGVEDGQPGGDGGEPATCPPATGPISGGVVQPLSDAIRNGGGAPLADVIDQINCQLIQGTLGL
jgi:hypothetical protein